MSKSILIHTIGNRDLQFDRTITAAEMKLFEFEENSDENTFYVLKKKYDGGNFNKQSKALLGKLRLKKHKALKDKIHFPMLEQVCNYVISKGIKLDKVVLCVSKQIPPYGTDTNYIADVIHKYFENQLIDELGIEEIGYEYMSMNLRSRQDTFVYCYEKMLPQLVKGYDKVFISHKQGHPSVTFSLILAGLFEPYTYLVSNAKGPVQEENIQFFGNKLKQKLGR